MKRSALVIVILLALALAAGCTSGSTTKPAGGGGTAPAAKEPFYAEPYPTITPESANEKSAAANATKALQNYITNTEAGNKQNGTNTPIFTNKEGYTPRLIGYAFDILAGKRPDGQFGSFLIQAYGPDMQIKPLTMWERYGGVARGDGKMNESFYKGSLSTVDASTYLVGLTPESAGEKAAMAAVEAWVKSNIASEGYDRVLLTGYAVLFGEIQKPPSMLMLINPEGTSYLSTINWGEQK
ncbi:MAG: hypothetical protein Q7W16_03395 [Coriobacteriia bacterium]|nr:hypothetical protein [Coriobacteriia bacterium]